MGTSSLYRISEVEAKVAKPQTIYNIIHDILVANDDACYIEMERYLRGVANTGSAQFDHCHCVLTLLKHDKDLGSKLHVSIKETGLNDREIWERLQRVLRNAGFKFQHGKMTGTLLEDQSEAAESEEAA